MQVRQLEQSVEMPLFEQIGRKIYRTKAGEIMLGYALTIQERLALAKRDNGRAQGD
jgi:DNA-binding transcriptional LysR family regulator